MIDLLADVLTGTNYSYLIKTYPNCISVIEAKLIFNPAIVSFRFDNVDWNDWQLALKKAAKFNQGYQCICGQPLFSDSELHHALLTKADLRGVKHKEEILHHSYNVIELHHQCHEGITREKSFNFLKTIFNENLIKNWYLNVPLKMKPRNIW